MNKKTIITNLLALIAVAGQAQVKCHVEGTLETDAWGDEVIICEAGTDLRVVDEPRFHVKAKGCVLPETIRNGQMVRGQIHRRELHRERHNV